MITYLKVYLKLNKNTILHNKKQLKIMNIKIKELYCFRVNNT